jgi:hypothetical protein
MVIVDAPLVATLVPATNDIAGESYVMAFILVPTTAETVTAEVLPNPYKCDGAAHLTMELDVQAAVRHAAIFPVAESTLPVGVLSVIAKLRPINESIELPERAAFPWFAVDNTGLSKENFRFVDVPTIAMTLTASCGWYEVEDVAGARQ